MPPKKKEQEKPVVEEKFQGVDVSTKDPHTVVLLLDSPEVAIVCKACEALHKHMEKSEQNRLELRDLDVVPRLVHLLSASDKATRSYSILCLSIMATSGAVRRVLYRTNCVPPLLALLKPEEELVCHERASFAVSELAGSHSSRLSMLRAGGEYSFKVELQKHSAHEPLIALLHSADPDVQRNCVKALSLLVEHYQSRPAIREAGGLPTLLELLESEYAIVQELALKTLTSCMHDAGCRKAFVEGEGLAKLVAFIGNKEYGDLHVLAVSLLALCLEDAGSMVALQRSGCLQQLMGHISDSTGAEMKRNAAKALAKAARNSVNQKILHEQEVEKTFVQLISSEDGGVCVAGADGVSAMAALSSSRQVVGRLGGVGKLVQCVGREEGRVRAAAVQALSQVVTEAPANCKLLSESGGVEALVQLLGDSEAECRQFAADCISSMAPDESLRSELIAGNAVPSLVCSLSFPLSSVQTSSAEALGMLACDTTARDQFSSSGGVSVLLPLLRSTNENVCRSAVWALSVCAQSSDVAEAACEMGGLEHVGHLAQQGGQRGASARAALTRLMDGNLPAKYWVTGHLAPTDILMECEFFDAGLAQSTSVPFTSLSSLLSQPLSMNRPILTVSLLAKPPPPAPSEDTPTTNSQQLDNSHSATSIGSRSKSRTAPTREGKGKKGRDREAESRVSEESEDQLAATATEKLPGLLPHDPALWTHISHVRTLLHPLPSTREQVEQLARYVSDSLGGVVKTSGTFGFELPVGEVQRERQSNVVPLGEVGSGVFQHRALLFKVLCDQLGVGCSLVRGEYGRHWNEVALVEGEGATPQTFTVDLMFQPGHLMPCGSPEAGQYKHI